MKITMSHGSGGKATSELIEQIFRKSFSNNALDKMEDAAVLTLKRNKIAFTTDSYVVLPIFFNGGDIGRLSVCGTVNDILMMGAKPLYISSAFIIEEGMEIEHLEKISISMKIAAEEAGIKIVAGDTKVIEGKGGIYINTSGIGSIEGDAVISSANAKPGDAILLSGCIGNHHACILSSRMGIKNNIKSDCAPLKQIVMNLLAAGVKIKAMRDVTRGGLATVLNEIAEASKVGINISDEKIPLDNEVRGFCDILGLDPLYMGNEGKMVCIVASEDAEKALGIMRRSQYGANATIIGSVVDCTVPRVTAVTRLGGSRIIDVLYGEGLPRIC